MEWWEYKFVHIPLLNNLLSYFIPLYIYIQFNGNSVIYLFFVYFTVSSVINLLILTKSIVVAWKGWIGIKFVCLLVGWFVYSSFPFSFTSRPWEWQSCLEERPKTTQSKRTFYKTKYGIWNCNKCWKFSFLLLYAIISNIFFYNTVKV